MDNLIERLENLSREDLLLVYGALVAYPFPGDQVHKIILNAREVVQEDDDYMPQYSDDQVRELIFRQSRTSNLLKSLGEYLDALAKESILQ